MSAMSLIMKKEETCKSIPSLHLSCGEYLAVLGYGAAHQVDLHQVRWIIAFHLVVFGCFTDEKRKLKTLSYSEPVMLTYVPTRL